MNAVRSNLHLAPGVATTVFVLLCSMDSALGNVITVPVGWLVGDAVVGIIALGLAHRRRHGWALAAAVLSTAAMGTAVMVMASIARSGTTWKVLCCAIGLVLAEVVRWQWPWTPDAAYQHQWWGVALILLTVTSVVAWARYVGAHHALVASLREQNAALVRSRDIEVEAADARRRESLSREMHDVLAHRLSLVAMHSSALEHRRTLSDVERIASGRIISTNARASLTELRAILSDLREPEPGSPQPDIADLPGLVREGQSTRYPIELQYDLADTTLPGGIGRHLYRIAQEGITNARKHGAPGPIDVRITDREGTVGLAIINRVGRDRADSGGNGLKGITERVHLCQGQLTRSVDQGVHVLSVRVPLPESA